MSADFVHWWLQVGWCCIVISGAGVLPPSTVGCLDSKHSRIEWLRAWLYDIRHKALLKDDNTCLVHLG